VELSYIFSAIRRRWWLVVLVAGLGAVGGYLANGKQVVAYEARALVNIQPPQNALGGTVFVNDPDRYVQSQLSVLQSSFIAEKVAAEYPGETTESISKMVTVTHEPRSDLVSVGVTFAYPNIAAAIANTYANTYIADLKKRAADQQGPAVASFTQQLAQIKTEIVALQKSREANSQVINAANLTLAAPTGVAPSTLNEVRQRLDTALDSNGQIEGDLQSLRAEQAQVLSSKAQLEQAANVKVASEVVQPAVVPTVPLPTGSKLLPIAGLMGGGLLGLALALALARLSGKAVDEQDVSDALGQPVVGRLARSSAMGAPLPELLTSLPSDAAQVADQLCVRAEARATDGKSLTVLVAGSCRPASTSTLAVALASRFAQSGLSVALIDADQQTAAITHEFRADQNGGIPAFLARSADVSTRSRTRSSTSLDDTFGAFTETSLASVEVLGLGPVGGRSGLRRTDVAELLSGAMAHAHVVVIDGGALLEAATTMQFAQMVDAVVLTVPMKSQRVGVLEDIADQLGTQRMKSVLPVVTHPARARS
jgi:uncharacterized protein involved in exopolysaccharide biosynthesis/Mrp family chromosome partitioning ATPase